VEKEPAIEEIEYVDKTTGKYLIKVEIEPLMTSLNTSVRTPKGEPLYVVRWSPKVNWRKIE